MNIIDYKIVLKKSLERYKMLINKYPKAYKFSIPNKDKIKMKKLEKQINLLEEWEITNFLKIKEY